MECLSSIEFRTLNIINNRWIMSDIKTTRAKGDQRPTNNRTDGGPDRRTKAGKATTTKERNKQR